MLLQFSVENFKSFKDKTIFSLQASSAKENYHNVMMSEVGNYLRVVSIYGANASGKSNFFDAFTAALLTIRNSANWTIDVKNNLIIPFRFADTREEPSGFEFVFMANNLKYIYGFSLDENEVYEEYLYCYKSQRPSMIFERSDGDKYKYSNSLIKKELKPLEARNAKNKLFLSTSAIWNCNATKDTYLWFKNEIEVYNNNFEYLLPYIGEMYENDNDLQLKNFTKEVLRQADINILDFDFGVDEVSDEEIRKLLPNEFRSVFNQLPKGENKKYDIKTKHVVDDKTYICDIDEESAGTKNLLMLCPLLKDAFENGKTILIDEFDKSLHPHLVIYLIKLFNDPNINKGFAQLIISSHTTSLLSLDYLRRDQIYFIEKDRDTACSELYSLADFSPRKSENILNAYLNGRYGAIPNIVGI